MNFIFFNMQNKTGIPLANIERSLNVNGVLLLSLLKCKLRMTGKIPTVILQKYLHTRIGRNLVRVFLFSNRNIE